MPMAGFSFIVTVSLLAAIAAPQSSLATGSDPAAPAAQPSVSETAFIMKAAQNAMTEVALGIAAISRSSSEAVRNFALTMVREHREAQQRLEVLAQSKDLEMPSELDPQHKAFVKGMRARWGAMFDSAYAAHMVSDNQNAITLFKGESTAQDQDLAAYAVHTLPTLESNEQLAERLVLAARQTAGPTFSMGPKVTR